MELSVNVLFSIGYETLVLAFTVWNMEIIMKQSASTRTDVVNAEVGKGISRLRCSLVTVVLNIEAFFGFDTLLRRAVFGPTGI